MGRSTISITLTSGVRVCEDAPSVLDGDERHSHCHPGDSNRSDDLSRDSGIKHGRRQVEARFEMFGLARVEIVLERLAFPPAKLVVHVEGEHFEQTSLMF